MKPSLLGVLIFSIVFGIVVIHTPSASAKIYQTINGTRINVPEMPIWRKEVKIHVLLSGLKWIEEYLVPVVKAAEMSLWDGYLPLKRVCSCESWWSPNGEPRQFREDGTPLWGQDKNGKIVKRDVGACQINTIVHAKKLKTLGLDVVNSKDDNVKFAKILYDNAGLKPWEASKECWK